jgi:hypothetical protein
MKKYNRTICWLILFNAITASQALGQVAEKIAELSRTHPNENIVTLYESKKYRIELKDNKPKVYLETYTEEILLKDNMAAFDAESVSFSKFRTLKNLEAWTMTPVENKYKKIEVSKFENKKELSNRIFHDDLEEKTFKYPQLKKGAIKCLKAEYEFEMAEFIDLVTLMSEYSILKYDVELEVDNSIKLSALPFNQAFTLIEKKEKKTTTYTAHFENLKKYKGESAGTDYLYFAPHIRFRIDHYINKKDDTIPVLRDMKSLYRFNSQFVQTLTLCQNTSLKNTVDSLIKGESDPILKAKKIYYWVKQNIKYIAFEAGFQGYIPREADDIYTKKYGDCKDMANIIHKMYTYAQLDSVYLTWVGSSSIPYKISDVYMPCAFNHMITAWKHKGQLYYLDATNQHAPWGLPSPFIQGKEALLGIDKDNYEVHTIPVVDYMVNKSIKNIELKIKGDSLLGRGEYILTGFCKNDFIYRSEGLTSAEKFQTIKNRLEIGNNKFMLNNYKEINRNSIDSSLLIKFEFTLPSYVSNLNGELFLNPFLEKNGTIDDLNENRISGFKTEYKSYSSSNITIQIPSEYKLKYIPKNEQIELDNLSFVSNFTPTESSLNLTYEQIYDFIILPRDAYKQIKNYQDKISEIFSETISFKKQ